MPEQSEVFEGIVKKHVDAGADVHTAFGRAIDQDPEAYGNYLKKQKQVMMGAGMNEVMQ